MPLPLALSIWFYAMLGAFRRPYAEDDRAETT